VPATVGVPEPRNTWKFPLLAAEVVPTRSSDPLVTEADQFSVPPPLFETLIVWLRGPPPPATAENDNDVGFTLIVGVWAINPGCSNTTANQKGAPRASWRIISMNLLVQKTERGTNF
jgi:hypothetical protein